MSAAAPAVKAGRRSMTRFERWTIFFAFVGALVAALTLGILYRQLKLMDGQLTEMRSGSKDTEKLAQAAKSTADATRDIAERTLKQAEATNELAKAAKRQAEAAESSSSAAQAAVLVAKKNLVLAQDSVQVQERPWVGTVVQWAMEGESLKVTSQMMNHGKTPAFGITFRGGWTVTQPIPGMFHPVLPLDTGSTGVLMPSGIWDAQIEPFDLSRLSPRDRAAFNQGRLKLYFVGEITYGDIFTQDNGSKTRVTHYCGFWNVHFKKGSDCPLYNDAT